MHIPGEKLANSPCYVPLSHSASAQNFTGLELYPIGKRKLDTERIRSPVGSSLKTKGIAKKCAGFRKLRQFEIKVLEGLKSERFSERFIQTLILTGGTMPGLCYGLNRVSANLDFRVYRRIYTETEVLLGNFIP